MAEPRYRISTVAKLSGLSTHAIRVWERRYEALSPERSPGGARLYSDREVDRLRLLKRAVDRGHAIGQLVGLTDEALARLASGTSEGSPEGAPGPDGHAEDELVKEILESASALDGQRIERLLYRAEARLSARALLQQVLAPLLEAIGDSWKKGDVCSAGEHLTTILVRERATAILRRFPREPGRPLVLVTTPAGELHELGALLAAATCAMQGAGLVYLGPNLPVGDIVTAARAVRANVVALSVVALAPSIAVQELNALAQALPARIQLLVGGAGTRELGGRLNPRLALVSGLSELERWLEQR